MTPCEKLGYKVGDRFTIKGSATFNDGSVIELEHDDGSGSPLFKLISGSCKYKQEKTNKPSVYCLLGFVQKIQEKEMTHQKEPHAHAEMMKAYADDVSLCVFIKCNELIRWEVSLHPSFTPYHDYFLCLPKHKEACLHWLNGGDVQNNISNPLNQDSWVPFCRFDSEICELWSVDCNFMRDQSNFRIKPKKEKRWIGFMKDNTVVNEHFSSKDELLHYTLKKYTKEYSKTLSAHEIEVEA